MAHSNTLMNQLLIHIPRHDFQTLVSQWGGDRYAKTFTTWNQFVPLLYAQAGDKRSLRDVQNGLSLQSGKLYHLGFTAPIPRSTLSDANARRNWAIFHGQFDPF